MKDRAKKDSLFTSRPTVHEVLEFSPRSVTSVRCGSSGLLARDP